MKGEIEFGRREFILSTLSAGFALAVQPIAAGTITTTTEGLIAGEVKIPVVDGTIPAYRAKPAKGKALPTVLVIQEIFGVHEHIKDVCRRFAKLGYLAIAPELFARQGDVSKMTEISEIVSKVVSKVPDAQVFSDLDAVAAWAKRTGEGNPAKLGVTGFCWGGRMTWLYANHNPKVRAGVAWYGRLTGDRNPLQPKYPLDIVPTLRTPILGLYGGADELIPNDTVKQMEAALKKARNPSQIILYPNTPHGFYADYRPTYREKEAQDAWKRLQAWFKRYGVA